MTRITSTILVFMIIANGGITIMEGSGLNDDLGVTLAPGVDQATENATAEAKKAFNPNSGPGETLFAMFASVGNTIAALFKGVFALPQMFLNLGFPEWIVLPLFAPMYIVSTLELIYAASGRSML